MTPAEMTALLKVLQSLASTLGDIGLPGMVGMMLLGPTVVLGLVIYMNHLATVRAEKAQDAFEKRSLELLEAYRADTTKILQDMGERHDEVVRRHDKALSKLHSAEQNNAVLHTIVVNNTTAMEQLKSLVTALVKDRS